MPGRSHERLDLEAVRDSAFGAKHERQRHDQRASAATNGQWSAPMSWQTITDPPTTNAGIEK
jgi:hypothetical protein